MVRGRLTAIDGVPVTRAVTKEDTTDDITQRDLNLTWSSALPPTNSIVAGEWWSTTAKEPLVSVEERLAQKFDIRPGRMLTFVIGGVTLEARVASLRKVQWDSFQPNYYMIFPPGLLDGQPATYLTSFYLTPEQKPLLAEMIRAYPSVTVLETDRVIAEVRGLLAQVTLAVEGVLAFVLAAGLAVLFAALNSTLDERRQEGALLRAFGATTRRMRAGQLAEFALLGGLSGLLAALGTELISWGIYTRVLSLEYAPAWRLWLGTPLAGALLLAAAGYHGMRSVRRSPPISVLREL
jgi:putative ABC transport system permease protein